MSHYRNGGFLIATLNLSNFAPGFIFRNFTITNNNIHTRLRFISRLYIKCPPASSRTRGSGVVATTPKSSKPPRDAIWLFGGASVFSFVHLSPIKFRSTINLISAAPFLKGQWCGCNPVAYHVQLDTIQDFQQL